MRNPLTIFSLAVLMLVGVNYLGAWQSPGSNPPSGNVSAPINTGSADQTKSGGLGVDRMSVADGFGFSFKNTSGNANTAWRLVRNDGTGNFHIYLNSTGGTSPTFETSGHAFHAQYNPSNGIYAFETADGSRSAGSSITWDPAFRILPGGKVGASEYCDFSGNNCSSPGGSSCSLETYKHSNGRSYASSGCPSGWEHTGYWPDWYNGQPLDRPICGRVVCN